jgi:hypothetical protein
MSAIFIERIDDSTVRLAFPQTKALIAAFKAIIGPKNRKRDDTTKVWRVEGRLNSDAAERWFYAQDWEERTAPSPMTQQKEDWALFWLTPGAPKYFLESAYRTLTRIHHPDSGGSEEEFLVIQDAYERLLKTYEGA